MRIVATSDTHFPVDPKLIPPADVFLHCGDLMQAGYQSEWQGCLDWLSALPHDVKLFVPGNHDFHLFNYPGPALQDLRKIGVTVLGFPGNTNYYRYQLDNGMIIGGCPYVTDLDRWAFNATEETVKSFLKELGPVDILATHSPPYGYLDKLAYFGINIGINAYNEYLNTNKVKHMIFGHVHECNGTAIHESGCMLYNVAMCDRKYTHYNSARIIDL